MRTVRAAALLLGLLFTAGFANGTSATPLDIGSWLQVARIAPGDGGMFNGNGDLLPTYSFGTYSSVLQSTDFEIPFSVYTGMQILFITGDNLYWGQTSYSALRALIDAKSGDFNPNISFSAGINGVEQNTIGNVLSRTVNTEDPWIGLSGSHSNAADNGLMLWGESNYPAHNALKDAHNGINVFVSLPVAVPGPLAGAGLPGLALAFGGLLMWRHRKRKGAFALADA